MSTTRTIVTAAGPVIAALENDLVRARGIPYATAERFGLPEEVDAWTEPRDAVSRGPSAPQDPAPLDSVAGPVGEGLDHSEDCLVVTVTAMSAARDHPVMVWLHGGAYVSGAGEAREYDADDLTRQGVVTVCVTYRLGVLGYLSPSDADAVNLGLHDQIAALRWVRRNIAAFGGDPERVTLFGHSAGGDAVVSVLLSDAADGLYQRAIVQSSPLRMRVGRAGMTDALRTSFAHLVSQPTRATVTEILDAQRRLTVMAAGFGTTGALPFAPEMGRAPLPAESDAAARLAVVAPAVDLLVGHTAQDASPFVLSDRRAVVLTRFGALGRLLLRPVIGWITRSVFGRPARDLATQWSESGGNAARYVFTWAPRTGPYGACHSIELPFLFSGRWDAPMLGGEEPNPEVAARIRKAWAAFAHKGVDGLESRSIRF